jgi:hypothetical protein
MGWVGRSNKNSEESNEAGSDEQAPSARPHEETQSALHGCAAEKQEQKAKKARKAQTDLFRIAREAKPFGQQHHFRLETAKIIHATGVGSKGQKQGNDQEREAKESVWMASDATVCMDHQDKVQQGIRIRSKLAVLGQEERRLNQQLADLKTQKKANLQLLADLDLGWSENDSSDDESLSSILRR